MSTPASQPRVGFTSELGLSLAAPSEALGADELVGTARVVPELCAPEAGVLRPSVLLAWADIVTGWLANRYTLPQICLTVDLDVRVARPIPVGADVRVRGRILKSGRTIQFCEAIYLLEGSEEPVAIALATFVSSPRPDDDIGELDTDLSRTPRIVVTPPEPVAVMLGTRVVGEGVVEVDRHQRIINWADTIQGGAVCAVAEEAVLALDPGHVPSALSVRFTGTVRVGPMRATAERLGPWVHIEVRDVGNGGRLAAVAFARAD
jgi:acyl-coenzyme A thioesterase PaaI-like protein